MVAQAGFLDEQGDYQREYSLDLRYEQERSDDHAVLVRPTQFLYLEHVHLRLNPRKMTRR